MLLDYYNAEKVYEYEQKEREKKAREFWKWAKRPELTRLLKQKEVNDN